MVRKAKSKSYSSRTGGTLRHPLTAALGSRAAVATIRELSLHGGFLSAPLLARQTGLARGSIFSVLKSLTALRLVEMSGAGRAILYRISQTHPLADALKEAFDREQKRFDLVLNEIGAASKSGALFVWVYGSTARGEDTERSDIDVLVGLESKNEKVMSAVRNRLFASGERLGFTPSVVFVDRDDIARLTARADPWWANVKADALVLRGRRPEQIGPDARRAGRTALRGARA